jgi:FG-GAP-like repeat
MNLSTHLARRLAYLLVLVSAACWSQIQVKSATPSSGAQGTVNLNVAVTGNGFKKGAKAQWFVTGTTNPGGVTVNSTTFNGSGQLTANITISSTADLSGYDIQVTNSDGRTGVGTELFAVTSGPKGCTTTGTPAGFTLVGVLNAVQGSGAPLISTGIFGNAIRVRPVDLNGDGVTDALVGVITSGNSSTATTYAFLLDPNSGLPLASNPITGAAWQNPITVMTGAASSHLEVGDVNGDGIPDFIQGSLAAGSSPAYLYVGAVANNTLSYKAYTIPVPANSASFGVAVAIGDLDGDGKDEVAIGGPAVGAHGKTAGAVFLYKYDTSSGTPVVRLVKTITDPGGTAADSFGYSLGIGNVEGSANGQGLVVGAPTAGTNGLVYVFHSPVLTQTSWFTLSGPGTEFGWGLEVADVDGDQPTIPDVVITNKGSSTTPGAMLYPGPISVTSSFTGSMLPINGLTNGWDWPNMDLGNLGGVGAVLVGAPNADNAGSGSCGYDLGAAHLFMAPFSLNEPTTYLFEPPVAVGADYGYGVGIAAGYPYLYISAHYLTVGNLSMAGQVYVYKKN